VGSPTTITLDPNDGDITNILRIDSQGNLNLDFTHDQFGNILQTNNGLASYTNVTNNDGELTSLFDSRNSEDASTIATIVFGRELFLMAVKLPLVTMTLIELLQSQIQMAQTLLKSLMN
jgi:hypothetical protein